MNSPSPCPWWNKRRWRVAAALWLLLPVVYVGAYGPIIYACFRGWLSNETHRATYRAYAPLASTLDAVSLGHYWRTYHDAARGEGVADNVVEDGEIGGFVLDVF